MPASATAAIGIGGSIAQGVMGSNTAKKNAALAQNAANTGNAGLQSAYNTASANLSPYITNGGGASNTLAGLLGTGGNAAASQNAFNTYLGSTNYNFLKNQGIQGVASGDAAALNSGATLKGINDYSQSMAQSGLGNYESLLGSQAALGNQSGTSLGSLGLQSATSQANNLLSAAGVGVSANNASLNSLNNMINGIGGSLTSFGASPTGQSLQSGIGSLFGGGQVPGANYNIDTSGLNSLNNNLTIPAANYVTLGG